MAGWPGFENHEGFHGLPPVPVRDANGYGLGDLGVLGQDLIDVLGINIEPAGNDHVLFDVQDVEISVLIHAGDVAGDRASRPAWSWPSPPASSNTPS